MNPYNGFTPAERYAALRWAREQDRLGLRPAAPRRCDSCGQTVGIIERHSEDYSKPYGPHIGAFALCYRCHMAAHTRFRSPRSFESYLVLLRDGAIFVPFERRDFGRFRDEHLVRVFYGVPQSFGPVRPRPLLLERIAAGEFVPIGRRRDRPA